VARSRASCACKGIQGHIAYPHLARNPIHQAAPALAELAAIVWDQGNDHFPPTSWQMSNIHAGTGANNVIPGELVIDFNFRFSTESTPESLQTRLEDVLRQHGLSFHIDWTLGGRPFLTRRGPLVDAMAAAIQNVTGLETELSTTGGTSDGRFIAQICPQVVEFGPVNASIHKIDEHVAVADIEPAEKHLPADAGKTAEVTVLELIEQAAARLTEAQVGFGHGTTNAFRRSRLAGAVAPGPPLDALDDVADTAVSDAQQSQVHA
jgi:succinyl-diaminopimelate desuccinylase